MTWNEPSLGPGICLEAHRLQKSHRLIATYSGLSKPEIEGKE